MERKRRPAFDYVDSSQSNDWSRAKRHYGKYGLEISETHFDSLRRLDKDDHGYIMSDPWRKKPSDPRLMEISKKSGVPPEKLLVFARINSLYMH